MPVRFQEPCIIQARRRFPARMRCSARERSILSKVWRPIWLRRAISFPAVSRPANTMLGRLFSPPATRIRRDNTSEALPVPVTAQRAPFDIGISGISMTPAVIAPGRTFALAGDIRNTSRSTGIYQLRIYYLSPDQTITSTGQQLSTNLFSLAGSGRPLATAAITLPSAIAVGKDFAGVILESRGDSNPADNVSNAFAIQVGTSAGPSAASLHSEDGGTPASAFS